MPQTVEERLRTFIERGYRPTIRSHALHYTEDLVESGWAVLSGIKPYEPEDPPRQQCIGWCVDAVDATGSERAQVIGGTFPTMEEALDYSLAELDEVAYVPTLVRCSKRDLSNDQCVKAVHPRGTSHEF